MIFEILKRAMIGIGYGGIITFLALTLLKAGQIEVSVDEIWLHMAVSLAIGVYFGVASLIFDNESWSPLKQTAVHFLLSLAFFFPIAIGVGWIPSRLLPVIAGLAIFIIIYAVFWFCIRWYLKKLESSMNHSIK